MVLIDSYPKSVKGPLGKCPNSLENQPLKQVDANSETTVTYTYSVYWREDVKPSFYGSDCRKLLIGIVDGICSL